MKRISCACIIVAAIAVACSAPSNNNIIERVRNSHVNRVLFSNRRYKMEIKETRKQRMLEGKNDNALLINLLSTWKDVKRIRSLQGYTSTNVKLQILKSDDVVSPEEWQTEIKR